MRPAYPSDLQRMPTGENLGAVVFTRLNGAELAYFPEGIVRNP